MPTGGVNVYRHGRASLSEFYIPLVMPPFVFLLSGQVFPSQSDTATTQTAAAVSYRRETLIIIFGRIENVFRRLEVYIDYPRTPGIMDAIVKVMAEVLSILAIVTKAINENRASELDLAKNMSPRLSNA